MISLYWYKMVKLCLHWKLHTLCAKTHWSLFGHCSICWNGCILIFLHPLTRPTEGPLRKVIGTKQYMLYKQGMYTFCAKFFLQQKSSLKVESCHTLRKPFELYSRKNLSIVQGNCRWHLKNIDWDKTVKPSISKLYIFCAKQQFWKKKPCYSLLNDKWGLVESVFGTMWSSLWQKETAHKQCQIIHYFSHCFSFVNVSK